jgi:hypothetical protein
MAFSLPFKQLAATAPVLRLLSQRDRNIRLIKVRATPFSGCGWHAYANLWCVTSVMIKPARGVALHQEGALVHPYVDGPLLASCWAVL